jgi:hypothetical protein
MKKRETISEFRHISRPSTTILCNWALLLLDLEKTEKHQENEVNDQEFNWNNVKRGNSKYLSNYMSVGNQFNHLKLSFKLLLLDLFLY